MSKLVYLVPLFPLIGFLINGMARKRLSKSLAGIIGSGVVLVSFIISVILFLDVKAGHTGIVQLFDFISIGTLNIPFAFQVDQLSAIFMLIITGVGFLIHVYSTSYMHEEASDQYARYFSFLNLFVFSMLLLVLGANYLIMFIGWEGVGLCSYLLIGYWYKNKDFSTAGRKAFVMNRIGDFGFLLAVFWMIQHFGSLNFGDVLGKAAGMPLNDKVLVGITLLLFLGAVGKSAQIPLYTWLPDAMAGPTPVSALIHAATMVTAGIYMIARSNILYTLAPVTQGVVAAIGLATAIFAASIALKQNDIKKVLAYSTVSQLGYMFLGLGVGAYTGAVFHVMTHAFFKALLFLGVGSVIHAMHHEQDIRKMGGLKKQLPVTHWTFLVACLAIAGIPPLSGFFSKDEILSATFSVNKIYWVIGVLGAVLTAFYMFRLYATTFLGKFRGTEEQERHLHESPRAMTVPLIVLAILSAVAGFIGIPAVLGGTHQLENFLSPVFAGSVALQHAAHPDHTTEYLLMGISVGLSVLVLLYAITRFSKKPDMDSPRGLGKLLENKWYVDELYDMIVVKPLHRVSVLLNNVAEKMGIDGVVNGVGKFVSYGSRQLRLLQNGQVGVYILIMVAALLILFIIQLFVL